MFYSQFILAKKGPLGTIWIAAHLERKLRKNQVADTDIGISVDSILAPDVPIALRLSSHLLLGVVRIYSRKVNYLFHDCSEALLKVKQAFRSAAVDLPPEESTAPYHSITLPETFHLDDFELPDTAFQGDFVDHHISSKEQITLQDNPERIGYLTSQFGLDERFGDGSSHIGLDLEEEMLKDHSTQLASIQLGSYDGTFPGQSSVPFTHMDVDTIGNAIDEENWAEDSKITETDTSRHDISSVAELGSNNDHPDWSGYNVQTPNENEMCFGNHPIGGPSADSGVGPSAVPAEDVIAPKFIDCAQAPSTPGLIEETVPSRAHGSPVLSPQHGPFPSNNIDGIKCDDDATLSSGNRPPDSNNGSGVTAVTKDHDTAKDVQVQHSETENRGACDEFPFQDKGQDNSFATDQLGDTASKQTPTDNLQNEIQQVYSPLRGNDSVIEAEMTNMSNMENCDRTSPGLNSNTPVMPSEREASELIGGNEPNEHLVNDFTEPEKMLDAPHADSNQINELGQQTAEKAAIESDGSVNRPSTVSSKKRRLVDSPHPYEVDGRVRTSMKSLDGSNSELIPDDDDLLASILVGKRIPGLTVAPSPPVVASVKRPRLMPKSAVTKRKVLLDDAMVLHADVIRQQLINTEDIRRVRKKAPCTRSEVWMIEKGSLEDEIFDDSIFPDLDSMQCQPYRKDGTEHHRLPPSPKAEMPGQTSTSEVELQDSSYAFTSDAKEPLCVTKPHSDTPNEGQLPLGHPAYPGTNVSSSVVTRTAEDGVRSDHIEACVIDGLDKNEDNVGANGVSAPNLINIKTDGDSVLIGAQAEVQVSDHCLSGLNAGSICSSSMAAESSLGLDGGVTNGGEIEDNTFQIMDVDTVVIGQADNNKVDSFAVLPAAVEQNSLLTVGETSELLGNSTEVGVEPDGDFAPTMCSDFGSVIDGVDTEFLNVDDDEDFEEEANTDMPKAGNLNSLENTGWSSRTRGVAKYLRTIFDEDSGLGRQSIAIDHLLRGKTRKEASRMFFETLVLKTRDYIHVEQERPFDLVNVKPGLRLMKSEF